MRKKSGITLIALVITIIIIIILATITINFAFGDNGLINMAEEARDLAANSTDYESSARANLVAYMNEFISGMNGGSDDEEEEIATAELEVIKRGEDTITVRVNGNNLSDYQFSIDGNSYTNAQSGNEYTFTGLTKVTANITNYESATGTKYTLYAKAKANSGEEVVAMPITTSTVVELEDVTGEARYIFNYQDLGEEILITGLSEAFCVYQADGSYYEYFGDNEVTDDLIIFIPSYIDGKPVTKISSNLLEQAIRKGSNIDPRTRIPVFSGHDFNVSYRREESDVFIVDDNAIYIEPGMSSANIYGLVGNMYFSFELNKTSTNISVPVQIKSSDIILPPTVNEIYTETTQSINSANIKSQKSYNNILLQKTANYEYEIKNLSNISEIPVGLIEFTITNLNSPIQAERCGIYVLGKDNANDIQNKETLLNYLSLEGTDVKINYLN